MSYPGLLIWGPASPRGIGARRDAAASEWLGHLRNAEVREPPRNNDRPSQTCGKSRIHVVLEMAEQVAPLRFARLEAFHGLTQSALSGAS